MGYAFVLIVAEHFAGAMLVFPIVWLLVRKKGGEKLVIGPLWFIAGLLATAILAGIIRVAAIFVVGSKPALNPEGGLGAFFFLALPILIALAVSAFLRTRAKAHLERTPEARSTTRGPSSSATYGAQSSERFAADDTIYAAIAKEIESGSVDSGLWTRLYGECDGDEAKTKAAYIRNRAARLSNTNPGSNSPEKFSQSKQDFVNEDRMPIDKKVGFVVIAAIVFGLIFVVSQMGKPKTNLVETDEMFPSKGGQCQKHSDCPAGPPAQMCNLKTKQCYVLEQQLYMR